MPPAGEIIVRTHSVRDITQDEASEIAAAIRGLSPDCEVRVEGQERGGVGVTLFEVLSITLAGGLFKVGQIVAEELIKKITDIFVDWARQRFKGRRSGSRRPVYLEIYMPDDVGNWVVKALVVKNAPDELEDRTEEKQRLLLDFRKRQAAPKGDEAPPGAA